MEVARRSEVSSLENVIKLVGQLLNVSHLRVRRSFGPRRCADSATFFGDAFVLGIKNLRNNTNGIVPVSDRCALISNVTKKTPSSLASISAIDRKPPAADTESADQAYNDFVNDESGYMTLEEPGDDETESASSIPYGEKIE